MRLQSHDQGFLAAGPEEVYDVLADPSTYESWWPGASASDGSATLRLGRRTVSARPDRHRAGVGLFLVMGEGSLEWYLEPFEEGTIVNAFTDLDLPGGRRRAERGLRSVRATLRSALVGLKARMEGAR